MEYGLLACDKVPGCQIREMMRKVPTSTYLGSFVDLENTLHSAQIWFLILSFFNVCHAQDRSLIPLYGSVERERG